MLKDYLKKSFELALSFNRYNNYRDKSFITCKFKQIELFNFRLTTFL